MFVNNLNYLLKSITRIHVEMYYISTDDVARFQAWFTCGQMCFIIKRLDFIAIKLIFRKQSGHIERLSSDSCAVQFVLKI